VSAAVPSAPKWTKIISDLPGVLTVLTIGVGEA
jgi:hypothetical protein